MTERPRRSVLQQPQALCIGPSSVQRVQGGLQYQLDERCAPVPWPVRGRISLHAGAPPGVRFALDGAGHHSWSPLAPCARVEVRLEQPRQSWSGHAYLDSNWGDRPLEQDFRGWQWARTLTSAGTSVFYEPDHRTEPPSTLAVRFAGDGTSSAETVPDLVPLARSRWGIARSVRSEGAQGTAIRRTLLDAPFYARTLIDVNLAGAEGHCVHESLNLERFSQRWVRAMLPFRMPRIRASRRPF